MKEQCRKSQRKASLENMSSAVELRLVPTGLGRRARCKNYIRRGDQKEEALNGLSARLRKRGSVEQTAKNTSRLAKGETRDHLRQKRGIPIEHGRPQVSQMSA